MTKLFDAAAIAGALALAAAAPASAAAPAAAPPAAGPAAHPAWPQQHSDLPADPAVRFGILANGMRYAIMKNATPAGEASLRLRIDAGSLDERDDQRGIAHFIEHMVLNGTRHVPEGEFVKRLEREGLRFGPDTNATTDFSQTIYLLDLPQSNPEKIATGLFLLREVADQALFAPAAIDRERGIILSEERSRATPQLRIAVDELGYLMPGDLLPRRLPIGSTDIIRTVGRDRLVDFYDLHYRPERATLIAIGDFDPAAVEAGIRSRFSTWRAATPPPPEPPAASLAPRGIESHVLIEPGGANRVVLSWVRPADLRPDSRAHRKERLIELLALQILNRRLERLSAITSPAPYVGVAVTRSNEAHRADVVQVAAVSSPGRWRPALSAIEQEQRRLVAYGVVQSELDREIAEIHAAIAAAAAGVATRSTPGVAQALVGSVNEDDVFMSPVDSLAWFQGAVKGLTAAEVSAAAKGLFSGGGPLLGLTSPIPVEGGEGALRAAYGESSAVAVAAPALQQLRPWPYQSFGAPGRVSARGELADLGITMVRFANGVRLTVKPTRFRNQEILVAVRYGEGQLQLPPDRLSPAWGLGAFTAGGLGRLTFEDMQQVLAGTVYSIGTAQAEDAFVLGGHTRPADFARQMQLLAAYVADPGWRPAGWNRLRGLSATIHDQLAATPGGVFQRDAGALLRSGDRRWATPTREEIASSNVGQARSLLAPALASGPLEIVIVGDVDVEEAIRQSAATFGALAPRAPIVVDEAERRIHFPAAALEIRTHKGRADQGFAFIAWPTSDVYSDQRRTRVLNVLGQVLQLRLLDEIREKQGTTYSPSAAHAPSENFPGYGFLSAAIEAPPEKLDGFFRDTLKIAQDLKDRPIGADELQRARRPVVESLERRRAGNEYWLDILSGLQAHPERADSIRSAIGQYRSVTAADLQQAAVQYLVAAKAWRMKVVPEAPQQAAAAPAPIPAPNPAAAPAPLPSPVAANPPAH